MKGASMVEQVSSILNNLQINTSKFDDSFYDGKWGNIIYRTTIFNTVKGEEIENLIYTSKFLDYGYCGLVGYLWVIKYLYYKYSLFNTSDYESIINNYEDLLIEFNSDLTKRNFDQMNGTTGYVSYLCYQNNLDHSFIHKYLYILEQTLNDNTNVTYYYNKSREILHEGVVNLGLAHGMAAILRALTNIYKTGIEINKSKELAYRIIHYYESVKFEDDFYGKYPNNILHNKPVYQYSKIAWCYGDLGIGYSYYMASQVFNDIELYQKAMSILQFTTTRRTVDVADSLNNPWFCHGCAGVAHIYNKLWHYTKNTIFHDAREFWMSKLIDYVHHEGDHCYFRSPDDMNIRYSVLNGNMGVGLVLHSYLTGDFDWDYIFLH